MTEENSILRGFWRLDLICCGRQDGHIVRETWDEADEFRKSYVAKPLGEWDHDRSAIMVKDHCHTAACNGYSDGCPLPGGSFIEASA